MFAASVPSVFTFSFPYWTFTGWVAWSRTGRIRFLLNWMFFLFLEVSWWFFCRNLWSFWLFGNWNRLLGNLWNWNWLGWIEGLIDGMFDVLFEGSGSIGCFFDLMNDVFAKVLDLMGSINCNIFNGFGSGLSSVLDGIGDVSNKIKLREDWSEEEWGKDEEFHWID